LSLAAGLRRYGDRVCKRRNVCAGLKKANDVCPLLAGWQCAEADVTHPAYSAWQLELVR